jgi:hypothetical protein
MNIRNAAIDSFLRSAAVAVLLSRRQAKYRFIPDVY